MTDTVGSTFIGTTAPRPHIIGEGEVAIELLPYQPTPGGPTRYRLKVPSSFPEQQMRQFKKNLRSAEDWLNGC